MISKIKCVIILKRGRIFSAVYSIGSINKLQQRKTSVSNTDVQMHCGGKTRFNQNYLSNKEYEPLILMNFFCGFMPFSAVP